MKCSNCPALRTEGYEYPESYCLLGCEGTRSFADGWSGCYRKPESIQKQVDKIEEKMNHQYDGIDEWIVEREIKEKAMQAAFKKEIHDYKYGILYLCFRDERDGHYYPIGADEGSGMASREMTDLLQMTYEDELRKREQEAYHKEVTKEIKENGRRHRAERKGKDEH